MADEKSLEELNTDLEGAVSEHGEDSEEAKTIQEQINGLKDKKKTYTWEELHEVREEAKKYRTDKADLKKKYEDIEKKLQKFEDEKLTDTEKDKKAIADLEKKLADIQAESKQKDIENLIVTGASGKSFADIEVVKMLAQKELASEDDVDSKTVGKVLDKIAKEKPYLIKSDKSATAGSGNFGRQNADGDTDEQKFVDWLRK